MVSTRPTVKPLDATRSGCAVTAMTCSAGWDTPPDTSQPIARRAFASVSMVPKDLEHTTKTVCSGRRPSSARSKSTGSMFETKRTSRTLLRIEASASHSSAGPRSLPPMPMFTTWVMLDDTASTADRIRRSCVAASVRSSSVAVDSLAARIAMCVTARPSVPLIARPATMSARSAGTPADRASASSASTTSAVRCCLEKSTSSCVSPRCNVRDNAVARWGSSAKRWRRFVARNESASDARWAGTLRAVLITEFSLPS